MMNKVTNFSAKIYAHIVHHLQEKKIFLNKFAKSRDSNPKIKICSHLRNLHKKIFLKQFRNMNIK